MRSTTWFIAIILAACLAGCACGADGDLPWEPRDPKPWPWEQARWEREAKAEAEARTKAYDAAHPDNPICPKCGHRMHWSRGTESNPTAYWCCGVTVEVEPLPLPKTHEELLDMQKRSERRARYREAAREAAEETNRKLAPEISKLVPSKEDLLALWPQRVDEAIDRSHKQSEQEHAANIERLKISDDELRAITPR